MHIKIFNYHLTTKQYVLAVTVVLILVTILINGVFIYYAKKMIIDKSLKAERPAEEERITEEVLGKLTAPGEGREIPAEVLKKLTAPK